MQEQAAVVTERAVSGNRRRRNAAGNHPPLRMGARALQALGRLSPWALFAVLGIGALALVELLTFAADLIAFRAPRLDMLLVNLAVGACAAGIIGFAVMLLVGHLRMQQKTLERFATVDELTGSPNRRVFLERLESEVDRCSRLGTRLCVVFVDIDHFKRINDDHGHQVGDKVLKEIFARMEESLRVYDFVGRYGGDEFVMALPGNDAEGGAAVAERLRESVREGPLGKVTGVTISLGVAELEAGMDGEGLLKNADMALYGAKNKGRNRTEMYTRGA
jgi:diguanylate cyclase (GGDEF)-like protein